jgi:hypothetical protein
MQSEKEYQMELERAAYYDEQATLLDERRYTAGYAAYLAGRDRMCGYGMLAWQRGWDDARKTKSLWLSISA